jgi:hypothetical protein
MSGSVSAFGGLAPAVISANLLLAQQALLDLSLGKQVTQVTYEMGDGKRGVTYKATDIGTLRALIAELQRALGLQPSRRALGVRF